VRGRWKAKYIKQAFASSSGRGAELGNVVRGQAAGGETTYKCSDLRHHRAQNKDGGGWGECSYPTLGDKVG